MGTEPNRCTNGHPMETEDTFCGTCAAPSMADLALSVPEEVEVERVPTNADTSGGTVHQLRVLAIAAVAVLPVVGFIVWKTSGTNGGGRAEKAVAYGSQSCTVSGPSDLEGADELAAVTVKLSKEHDLEVTFKARGPIPTSSDDAPGGRTSGYVLWGAHDDWRLYASLPLIGSWQAKAEGAVDADGLAADPDAVTVNGDTLTMRWPHGRFLDARTPSGDRVSLDYWSATAEFSDLVCEPADYAPFPHD